MSSSAKTLEEIMEQICVGDIDSYIKLEMLGSGTSGEVFKAMDKLTGEIVAIKRLRRTSGLTQRDVIALLQKETYLLLRLLYHPNIVLFKGLARNSEEELFMLFEYVQHDLSSASKKIGRRFSACEIRLIIKQILQGLLHCHRHYILHRDIKPQNILISDQKNVKLADFGLSTQWNSESQDEMTQEVVTPLYRCPELLQRNAPRYGPEIDIWSVGCVFAELLQGSPVFRGKDELRILSSIRQMDLAGGKKLRIKFSKFAEPSAVDSLERMLEMDSRRRITAEEALQSDYFRTDSGIPCQGCHAGRPLCAHECHVSKERFRHARDGHVADGVLTGQKSFGVRYVTRKRQQEMNGKELRTCPILRHCFGL